MPKPRRRITRQDSHPVHGADGFDDEQLLSFLRGGNEPAFIELVGRHHHAMVRLARSYVPNDTMAEDAVQETWLAVLRALPAFEGRSSVRTWLYRILITRARAMGVREHKHVPIADPEQVFGSECFNSDGSGVFPPAPWVDEVEDRVRAEKMAKSIQAAMDDLPSAQREVLTLRELNGMTATEAREVLALGDGHQRVLLHRARNRLRIALEAEYAEVEP